jgi:hypothetical protein
MNMSARGAGCAFDDGLGSSCDRRIPNGLPFRERSRPRAMVCQVSRATELMPTQGLVGPDRVVLVRTAIRADSLNRVSIPFTSRIEAAQQHILKPRVLVAEWNEPVSLNRTGFVGGPIEREAGTHGTTQSAFPGST